MAAKAKSSSKTKTVKKTITPASLVKKVETVSTSAKTLSKELKTMTKIFAENQKVLIAIRDMIDTLATSVEHVQKQSKQLSTLEHDTERLYDGLHQVRSQSSLVAKINSQTARLQEQLKKIESEPKAEKIMQAVSDSYDSIKNNTTMIIKISDRIENLREELQRVSQKAETTPIGPELERIKNEIESISHKASKIESLNVLVENLKHELQVAMAKSESISDIPSQIEMVKHNVEAISHRAGSFGNDILGIKNEVSALSDLINRKDVSISEFHQKADKLFQELQGIKSVTNKSSTETSKDVLALLKLSEFQSNMRMQAESKYGEIKDLEKMAAQTAEIINLFDKLSIESQEKMSLPAEVRQWAVSKILDCSDRWEIRFTDVFNVLQNSLGRNLLKDTLRIQQVRDIFGIRAVDEVRQELNIQTSSDAS
ncbi:MAG: chemotaxis protein [Nitrosopumilaceae archaeon]